MHRSPRAVIMALALLSVGSLAVGLQTPASAGPGPATPHPSRTLGAGLAGPVSHKVTLITGDVVTVTDAGRGKSTVSVERAPGSTGMIHTETVGKDLYVVPEEALPYLAA